MNKEDKVFHLATQLFLKKPLPTYMHDQNENAFRSTARDVFKVAELFVNEYDKMKAEESSNPPEDEL